MSKYTILPDNTSVDAYVERSADGSFVASAPQLGPQKFIGKTIDEALEALETFWDLRMIDQCAYCGGPAVIPTHVEEALIEGHPCMADEVVCEYCKARAR